MSLGDFYNQAEKIVLNDLITYQHKVFHKRNMTVLNIYCSKNIHIRDKPVAVNCSGNERVIDALHICNVNMVDMGIDEDPFDFIKKQTEYNEMLKKYKFDVINCRFSMRQFLTSQRDLISFISFMIDLLGTDGILMGFMLDINKLNGIFAESPSLFAGPYGIEYISPYDYFDENSLFKSVLINGNKSNLIDFVSFKNICEKLGLKHLDNIILESLYNKSLDHIDLKNDEKQFGFLNYVYLFIRV